MTVIEVIKQCQLENFSKSYKSLYGTNLDTKYPLDTLAKMEVKDIYINFKANTASMVLIDFTF